MSGKKASSKDERPMIEWIFGALSALVVAGLLAFLAYKAITSTNTPPRLSVVIESLEPAGSATLVVVAVTNDGDKAAAQVGLQATLARDGADAAPNEISFDFIAAGAIRRGAFLIDSPPFNKDDLRVTIHGFVEP